jgi:transposase
VTFSGRMLQFSGTRLASFALCVRRNRRGSQVWRRMFARAYRYLVNARHLKHVPGRKSDVKDCQWIQYLHTCGLLSRSFRPEAEMCALRAYLRHRVTLLEHRAAHIQHMQKALQQMNVQLTQVLSDITGATGMAIIRAILAGEREPVQFARFRDPRCASSTEDIAKALTGHDRPEHVFALKQALALYDAYLEQLGECDAEIARHFRAIKPTWSDVLPAIDRADKCLSHCKNAPAYDAEIWQRFAGKRARASELSVFEGRHNSFSTDLMSTTFGAYQP